jgi:hypothetical protein
MTCDPQGWTRAFARHVPAVGQELDGALQPRLVSVGLRQAEARHALDEDMAEIVKVRFAPYHLAA